MLFWGSAPSPRRLVLLASALVSTLFVVFFFHTGHESYLLQVSFLGIQPNSNAPPPVFDVTEPQNEPPPSAPPQEEQANNDDEAWKSEPPPEQPSENQNPPPKPAPRPPRRWESFAWDNDFYLKSGIREFTHPENGADEVEPEPFMLYPDYESSKWRSEWRGKYVPCVGARGKVLQHNADDALKAWPKIPNGFPRAAVGDANVTGIDSTHCFDRYHRYGPYGYGQTWLDDMEDWQRPGHRPDWTSVKWGELQEKCLEANRDRYAPRARSIVKSEIAQTKGIPATAGDIPEDEPESDGRAPHFHHRTAIVIRGWENYWYTDNDRETIRSMITETSLLTGGEYEVFLLVHVSKNEADIYENPEVYQRTLERMVPRELRSISLLWSERLFEEWYPDIGHWDAAWHRYMPLQWFSKTHPQFDFVWNWEVDTRYTGHHYQFFEAVAGFAKERPRKYLWERNQRLYFPRFHGTWKQFLADTDVSIDQGLADGSLSTIWGPKPYKEAATPPLGPKPPSSSDRDDDFEWGVGEEADLITLQPIWDPRRTLWPNRDSIWNYVPGVRPGTEPDSTQLNIFHHPEYNSIPRRAFTDTTARFSARLLHAMHMGNSAAGGGRTMQANMWPATVALEQGLKAVYAPHPIWIDRIWDGSDLEKIFNAVAGKPAQWSQGVDSVYGADDEEWGWFDGWSSYPTAAKFAETLYRRWLGWGAWDASPLTGVGGKGFENDGVRVDFEAKQDLRKREDTLIGGNGRMCLPAMLLHPLKRVDENAQRAPEPEPEDESRPEDGDESAPEGPSPSFEPHSPPSPATTPSPVSDVEVQPAAPTPSQATELVAPPKEFTQPEPVPDPEQPPAESTFGNEGSAEGAAPLPAEGEQGQTELEKQKQEDGFWSTGEGVEGQTDLEKNRQNLDAPGG